MPTSKNDRAHAEAEEGAGMLPSDVYENQQLQQISEVCEDIAACARASGRRPEDIRLIAVTKNRPPQDLALLAQSGLYDYGENRLDHLAQMSQAAASQARFHYLGRVQSRQFTAIAAACSVLHSLAELRHVPRLAQACRQAGCRMQVFCQVNPGIDPAKAGLAPDLLPEMLDCLAEESDVIEVVGLMTMAPDSSLPAYSRDDVRRCFAQLRKLAQRHGLSRLSMGMSDDYRIAIEEGATDLRIGSALFVDR